MNDDIFIYNRNYHEFEFDNFSILYDECDNIWFLETFEDDDKKITIILEDKNFNYIKENSEELNNLDFKEDDFNKIKNFLEIKG